MWFNTHAKRDDVLTQTRKAIKIVARGVTVWIPVEQSKWINTPQGETLHCQWWIAEERGLVGRKRA
jgi:hypothetical protein